MSIQNPAANHDVAITLAFVIPLGLACIAGIIRQHLKDRP